MDRGQKDQGDASRGLKNHKACFLIVGFFFCVVQGTVYLFNALQFPFVLQWIYVWAYFSALLNSKLG